VESNLSTVSNPAETEQRQSKGGPITRVGLGYHWEIPEHHLEIQLDYLALRGREIAGEFEFTYGGKHLLQGIHSLNSTQSRISLVRALADRTNGAVPWDRIIAAFCAAVLRKERAGDATKYTHDAPIARTSYLIERLVQEAKPNLLYGPGGAGKGYFAVATCVGVLTGHGIGPLTVKNAVPFYFDWEDDFDTFNARVKRLAAGFEIPVPRIAYRRMRGIAADRINEMARAIADENATFAVLDSVSACAGSPGRGETWDHIAHRLFDALDMITTSKDQPMTWLLIGHVTGDSAVRRGDIAGKMFGSIQNMNRARCAWEMRSDQDDDGAVVRATLYHGKWNHTGRLKPIGMTLTFDGESVRIDAADPRKRNTFAEQLADYFAEHGRASVRALSLAMRKTESSIRAEFSRHKTRFEQDEQGFWNLKPSTDTSGSGTPATGAQPEELPF
jgi:hypothetical protein